MTWRNLIGAALHSAVQQMLYRRDPRPFLFVKGVACQTSAVHGRFSQIGSHMSIKQCMASMKQDSVRTSDSLITRFGGVTG